MHKRFVFKLATLVLGVFVSLCITQTFYTSIFAQESEDIDQYQQDIDQKNKEKAEKEAILNNTKAEIDSIAQSGASLDQKIYQLSQKISQTEENLRNSEAELKIKEEELDKKEKELSTQREKIQKASTKLYKSSQVSLFETILLQDNPESIFKMLSYRKFALGSQILEMKSISEQYKKLASDKDELIEQQNIISAQKSALEESKVGFENEKARIIQEMQTKLALQNDLQEDLVTINNELGTLTQALQQAILNKTGGNNVDPTGGGNSNGGTSPQPVNGNAGSYDLYVDGVRLVEALPGPIRIVSQSGGTSGSNVFRVNGSLLYRGILEMRADTNMYMINELPLELYLRGLGEIYSFWPIEALKSQAVASRNYSVKNWGKRSSYGYSLRDDTYDQNYVGYGKEIEQNGQNWVNAVNQTANQVLYSGNDIIAAYYHSTCGGHTMASEEVWVTALPYTRAISDWYQDGGVWKSYDGSSPWSYKKWGSGTINNDQIIDLLNASIYLNVNTADSTRQNNIRRPDLGGLSAEALAAELGTGNTITDIVGEIQNVQSVYNNGSTEIDGTARKTDILRVTGTTGTYDIPGKVMYIVYNARSPQNNVLYSVFWTVAYEGGSWNFYSRGYPHRVGLCQYGAYGRAVAGQNYEQILTTYFTGTRLDRYTPSSSFRVGLTRVATGDITVSSYSGGAFDVYSNGVRVATATENNVLRLIKK